MDSKRTFLTVRGILNLKLLSLLATMLKLAPKFKYKIYSLNRVYIYIYIGIDRPGAVNALAVLKDVDVGVARAEGAGTAEGAGASRGSTLGVGTSGGSAVGAGMGAEGGRGHGQRCWRGEEGGVRGG